MAANIDKSLKYIGLFISIPFLFYGYITFMSILLLDIRDKNLYIYALISILIFISINFIFFCIRWIIRTCNAKELEYINKETFLYNRTEFDNEIVIEYRNHLLIFFSHFFFYFLILLAFLFINIIMTIILISMYLFYVIFLAERYSTINAEIKKIKKNIPIKISGSKWSINNPLKYVIQKTKNTSEAVQ